MRFALAGFRPGVDQGWTTLYRRLRGKWDSTEPDLQLSPSLETTKNESELDQILTQLNQNLLTETEPSDLSDDDSDDGWVERAMASLQEN